MICLLAPTKNASLEDYKKQLYAQLKFFIFIGLVGAGTLAVSIIAFINPALALSSYIHGFLTGFGSSLIVISIMLVLRTRGILKDEEKLKAERLKYQDERNVLINTQSLKATSLIGIFFLYVSLIASLFIKVNASIYLFINIMIFFIAFLSFNHYFSKRY